MHVGLLALALIACAAAPATAAPELLAPGMLSTTAGEYSPTYDVERRELIFMRRTPGRFDYTLYTSTLGEDGWSTPRVLPFSGRYRDAGPSFSPNGQRLLFDSRRPQGDLAEPLPISLWHVERTADGWATPSPVAGTLTARADEPEAGRDAFGPLETGDGTVVFYSFRQPYRGGTHYASDGGRDASPRPALPDPSAPTFVGYLTLSVDGRRAVIEGRSKRGDDTDLFYSCRDGQRWSAPQPIAAVNTPFSEGTPYLTSDGSKLLFASDRPSAMAWAATSNLYSVEMAELAFECSE